MGKWSQYRLRGTSRPPPPPAEVLLLDRSPTGGAGALTLGSSGANQVIAAKPVVISATGWSVTRLEAHMSKGGAGSPTQDLTAIIWAQSGAAPSGTGIASSAVVSATTVPTVSDWVSFAFVVPVNLPGPLAVFFGFFASASGGSWVNWTYGGSLGGGRAWNTGNPPTNNIVGNEWPWLRVYGFLLP